MGAVLAATLLASVPSPLQTTPAPPSAGLVTAARSRGRLSLDIALTLNGTYIADVTLGVAPDGSALVDVESLLRAIGPRLSGEAARDIRRAAASRPEVLVAELSGDIVRFAFDFASLRLNATVAQSATAVSRISLTAGEQTYASITPPANVSFGVSASLFDRYLHDGRSIALLGQNGVQGALRGYANVGGIDGINLKFDTGFRDTRNAFRRSEDGERPRFTVFKDDHNRAIRYAIGSIDPTTLGAYQVPLNLVGLSIERLYQTIQPYRNLRPAGRGALVLERSSQVQVLVNGVTQRTLQLAAGRYDLRDFPFLNGLNDVRLVVEDAVGRREVAALSFFSDTNLLDPGISNFSIAAGYSTGDVNGFTTAQYRRSPIASAYFQKGLTDRLTVGASAQGDRRNLLGTALLVTATPIGLLGTQAAIDIGQGDRPQFAALLSYRQQSYAASGVANGLSVDASYQSSRFTPMSSSFGFGNGGTYLVDARYQTVIRDATYASFGAGYERGGRAPGHYLMSATASRNFRLLAVNVSVDQRFGERGGTRLSLTVSRPIGRRTAVRARYNSFRNAATIEAERVAFPGLNQYGYRGALTRSDDGMRFDGQAQYYGNRFQGNVRHTLADGLFGRSEVTELAVTTGIGFADGHVAWGREADRGFVIVDKDRSLRNAEVRVRSSSSLGASASTGPLGAALVPLVRPYTRESIAIDVRDLPPGYDIGAGQYDLQQGAASGYHIHIGSAAANTVVGRLVLADGSPASLITGELQPLSGKSTAPIPFFTNRTGRLVAQRVAPGRYGLVVAGTTDAAAVIDVRNDANGLVDIGTISSKGPLP